MLEKYLRMVIRCLMFIAGESTEKVTVGEFMSGTWSGMLTVFNLTLLGLIIYIIVSIPRMVLNKIQRKWYTQKDILTKKVAEYRTSKDDIATYECNVRAMNDDIDKLNRKINLSMIVYTMVVPMYYVMMFTSTLFMVVQYLTFKSII